MKAKTFYKTRIATSISLLIGASAIAPAMAQEQENTEVEVINVTGIRGSMIKSMDIKRSSTGIVDAINAEDIGKFPDSNLAESLQRISGVSIDRNNGEGSKVTVRGFGPTRNLVTLNGRQLPTTTGERSFDFANLAAESVSGVEVYKTSQANVPTGGIGATINITTLKPLNNPGQHATFSAQAQNDTSSAETSITPELSGLYSNTSNNGKFGVALSASYSKRESGSQQASVGTGWRSFTGETDNDWSGDNAAWGGVAKDDTQTNRPGDDDIYSVPQTTIYSFEEQQRTRTNAQLVLQYSPIDDFTATVDYTYVQRDVDVQWNNVSAWYTFGNSENVWSDGPIASPLLYSETYDTPQDLNFGSGDYGTRDKTGSLGINLDWQVNDSLRLKLDYHNSSAKNTPNSPYGSSNQVAMAAFIRTSAATDFTGALPTLAVGGGNDVSTSDLVLTGSVFTNTKYVADIEQTQLHGEYVFDNGGSIDFGLSLTDSSNHTQSATVQRNNWGGEGDAGVFDSSLFERDTILDKFDDVSGGNFEDFGAEDYDILNTYYQFDFAGVRQQAETLFTPDSFDDTTTVGDCGSLFCPSSDYASATDQLTKEEMKAVYVQYNYQDELGDMPYDVHFGARYEQTDVHSTSAVPGYDGAIWEGDTEVTLVSTGEQVFESGTGSYSHFLPSINFNIEVVEDVILRAAFSKTIGRPAYTDLISGQTLTQSARVTGGTGSTGDPGLKPLESNNYDLSAEWYYSEGNYLSVGLFRKDVKNFISTDTVDITNDIVNPATGPYQTEALAAVGSDQGAQREYIYNTYGSTDDNVYLDSSGNIIIVGNTETDDAMVFEVSTPTNDPDTRTFDGWELTVQHLFSDTGIGLFGNYTKVNSENEYDNFVIGEQVAEAGISDTANLVVFYENEGLSARLAYNWRDKFFVSGYQGDVGAAPVYTEAYSQLDFNIGYDIPQVEGLNIFIQGINITNEYTRNSGRTEIDVLNVTQTGSRYSVGARYTF